LVGATFPDNDLLVSTEGTLLEQRGDDDPPLALGKGRKYPGVFARITRYAAWRCRSFATGFCGSTPRARAVLSKQELSH
jgi:hypothetical protein